MNWPKMTVIKGKVVPAPILAAKATPFRHPSYLLAKLNILYDMTVSEIVAIPNLLSRQGTTY